MDFPDDNLPPRTRPRPDLPSELPYLILPITLSCLGIVFLLYRHARGIKRVVQHQLQNITKPRGAIRLPEDEDPEATLSSSDLDSSVPRPTPT